MEERGEAIFLHHPVMISRGTCRGGPPREPCSLCNCPLGGCTTSITSAEMPWTSPGCQSRCESELALFTRQPSKVFIYRWHLGKSTVVGYCEFFLFCFFWHLHFLFLYLSGFVCFLSDINKATRKSMLWLYKITFSLKSPSDACWPQALSDTQIRSMRRESCWWNYVSLSLTHTLTHSQFIVRCRVHTFSLTKFNKINNMMAGRW